MRLLLFLIPFLTLAQQPAFPSAEGFAKYTVGGRGGTTYFVEHLNDPHIITQWRDDSEPSGSRVKTFANIAGDNLPDIWKTSVGLDVNTSYSLYDSDVVGETKTNQQLCQEQINSVLVANTGDDNDYVYFVPDTNSPNYDGSFRKACVASGARTVIFRVGGRLEVYSPIAITNPNITIAGQTAPGDGIMLTGNIGQPSRLMQIDTDEVIIRFLTLRRSESSTGFNAGDNLYISGGDNIIIDHVSTSWSSDGNIDIASYDRSVNSRTIDKVTVQYCLITNSYGGTNKAMLITGDPSQTTIFRNAFIGSNSRNPALSSDSGYTHNYDGNYEIVNNLWYDCYNGLTIGNVFGGTVVYNTNVINNWRKAANGVTHSRRMIRIGNASTTDKELTYVNGNLAHSLIDAAIESDPEWRMVQYGSGSTLADNIVPQVMRKSTPFAFPITNDNVTLWTGQQVRDSLLTQVGNYIQGLDSEDQRAIDDVLNETSTYNNITNTFPIYNNGTPYTDSNNDGIEDAWFTANVTLGDVATDLAPSGYSWLEEYINQVDGSVPPANNAPVVTCTSNCGTQNIEVGGTYNAPTGTWTDTEDGSGVATVGGDTVDVNTIGTYNVTLSHTDTGGLTDTINITVNVVAPVGPVEGGNVSKKIKTIIINN